MSKWDLFAECCRTYRNLVPIATVLSSLSSSLILLFNCSGQRGVDLAPILHSLLSGLLIERFALFPKQLSSLFRVVCSSSSSQSRLFRAPFAVLAHAVDPFGRSEHGASHSERSKPLERDETA